MTRILAVAAIALSVLALWRGEQYRAHLARRSDLDPLGLISSLKAECLNAKLVWRDLTDGGGYCCGADDGCRSYEYR